MAVFEGEVLRQTIAVANANKIEPAALLAVVEVESAGKSLEADGKTPRLLFERHVFYRELNKAGETTALNRAIAEGLAHNGWRRATQYKDQGRSADRLRLLQQVRAVNDECALRSCSWGVGQTMGFLAEELKFANARQMFNYMVEGGVPAQVACMVREIKRKGLIAKLNNHLWAEFASVYNGPSYKQNAYDVKMASAYAYWRTANLPKVGPPKPVVAPAGSVPKAPVATGQDKTTGAVVAGTAAGAGGAAGAWTYFQSLEPATIIFTVGIFIMIAVTVFVVLRRRRAKPLQPVPTGVLTEIEAEVDRSDEVIIPQTKKE